MESKRSVELMEASGPWPFTTRRTYRMPDASRFVWRSRHHRKRLQHHRPQALRLGIGWLIDTLWRPSKLNWWISVLFALGASLFSLGCLLTLQPALATKFSVEDSSINTIFFAGSIPFTTAAYLQLYQAANSDNDVRTAIAARKRRILLGWFPDRIGWLSCFLQFIGTILFNINTFDAMMPGLTWIQQDLRIWIPNVAGSVLFLASGYLAFAETCHAHFALRPDELSWWVTFVNLLGCVAFMISAVFAFVPSKPFTFDALTISVSFTLLGAVAFLAGSLLMMPESANSTED